MQAAQTLPPAAGLGEDFSHLRNLFARSFPFQDTDVPAAKDGAGEDKAGRTTEPNEDFDWSVTLDNIKELSEAAKEAEARLRDAEERAVRAEARAKVAEHWLRRLHQAVLEGLPQRAASGQ